MRSLQDQIRWYTRVQFGLGIGLVVVVLGFIGALYIPAAMTLIKLEQFSTSQLAQLTQSDGRAKILPTVAREVERLRAELNQSRRLSSQSDMPSFISDITTLSRQSDLYDFKIKPGAPHRSADGLFSYLPVQLNFETDYPSLFAFLREAEGLQRLTRVQQISVRKDQIADTKLKVQLSMNLYFSPED
jgi:Tfp pilus assembly protein PilO